MDEGLKEALKKVRKLASDANPKLQKKKRPRVLQYYRDITGKRTYPYAGQKKKARAVKDLGKKDTHAENFDKVCSNITQNDFGTPTAVQKDNYSSTKSYGEEIRENGKLTQDYY